MFLSVVFCLIVRRFGVCLLNRLMMLHVGIWLVGVWGVCLRRGVVVLVRRVNRF